MPRSKKKTDFEQSIVRLEKIVEALETGDLSLEQSLKSFEEGVALTRSCQESLRTAEQTIKQLSEKNGQPTLENFDFDSED